MCEAFLSHDYSDLQNSEGFRRMLAAVFCMRELLGEDKSKWWVPFLASKSSEEFRCDELVRTARECQNGREDSKAPGGYRFDAFEVYYLTVWRRWKYEEQHQKSRTAGATTIKEVFCRKDTCACPYKGAGGVPIDGIPVPPYKYGCNASLRYDFGV
jgi:hypothetical protein